MTTNGCYISKSNPNPIKPFLHGQLKCNAPFHRNKLWFGVRFQKLLSLKCDFYRIRHILSFISSEIAPLKKLKPN
jgi:hypothetical protein